VTNLLHNQKAGSVPALSDPLNTDASSPVSSDSSNDELLPEESSEIETGIDIEDLLNRMLAFYLRFVRLPSDSANYAIILWAAHTHLMGAWDTTPRLAFLAPESGCGKTRGMEIVALFAPRAIEAASVTTAALNRAVSDPAGTPTFFIDEIDTVYGSKGKGDEALRGFINAGHGRNGASLKCDVYNDDWAPGLRGSYAAIAMAGIGNLPDTILTRSIVIRMRKRALGENVEPYRQRDHMHLGHALRDELEQWAASVVKRAGDLRPVLPPEIVDRNADVWEPLIVVGDLAGGVWPDRARDAALEFVALAKSSASPSLGVQLLADIRMCFGSRVQVSTRELIEFLLADDEAPWGDLSGKKIDPRKLGSLLTPYGIKSETIREGTATCKGYKLESFYDAWVRYLSLPPESVTSVTSVTSESEPAESQKCVDGDGAMFGISDGCAGNFTDSGAA
jgi:Protein of unknown function (DUF3631)